MESSLQGKTILLTGASMGIGYALAPLLAEAGARLILTARSEAKLKSLAEKLPEATYLICDLAEPSQAEALAEQILSRGTLDGIIHNAGVGLYGELETLEQTDVRHLFEINFFSILHLTRRLLPLLKRSPQGRVVMISSVVSWRSIPRMSVYCASKAALNSFTEAVRVELTGTGIRLVNVYPGRTRTDFSLNAKSTGWRPFSTETGGDSAEKVAQKIVRAYLKGKRDEYVSLSNRLLIWGNFLFPGLIDWGLEKFFLKGK
jgi:short-subunit dehydrogenase